MENVLEYRHISKFYPGVAALNDVSVAFGRGEIHALMGENGAGKSTLIKIASGAVQPSEGEVIIEGEPHTALTPAKAKTLGIGVIYQEFNLVYSLSVAENVFLGEKIGGKHVIDFQEMHRRTAELLEEFGMDFDTHMMVGELSNAQRQMVEIVKALSQNAKVLIMDEPSAAIGVNDVKILFNIIRKLKERGVTVIYISHRMEEVFEIADRVSVLRDGCYVGTKDMKDTNEKDLIHMMVGRELNATFPKRDTEIGTEVVLEAKNLAGNGDYNINFKLHKGEVLGLAGLIGAGRSELAKVLFGVVPVEHGELLVNGKKVSFKNTRDAINCGIGLIPEDRKNEGAFQEYQIGWNISIMSLPNLSKHGVIDFKQVEERNNYYKDKLRVKTPSLQQYVKNLSGGNQQKVVVAKVLNTNADIIIFDEPTRGIDVGAKQEIYQLINELVEQGISVIMISSEMPELIGMSDRILVMKEGTIHGELSKEEFSQDRILEIAS